jgi:hypothetical protein
MITYLYKYIHVHPISIRLDRLDFEIHEVDYQEHLIIDGDVVSH